MRIPFPARIPFSGAAWFAFALAVVQTLEHTGIFFVLGCAAFILLATAAFNIAGGLRYVSGAFIFFNALLTVIFGVLAKTVLLEPGDSNLRNADLSIGIYACSMAGYMLAALVTRSFRPRKALLAGFVTDDNIRPTYIVLLLAGNVIIFGFGLFGLNQELGYLGSLLGQVNIFIPVGLLLGVVSVTRDTGGKRTMTPFLFANMFLFTAFAAISFSKQQMFSAAVAWLIACAYMRVRLRALQILGIGAFTFVAFYYGVPYSQVGRDYRPNEIDAIQRAEYLLPRIDEVRKEYILEQQDDSSPIRYYNRPIVLADRLTLLPFDDALIQQNSIYGDFGWAPLQSSIAQEIPRFLWPSRPDALNYGAIWANSMGVIGDDDRTTGISYSPEADAYREGGWFGVLLVQPLFFCLIFLGEDSVCGDAWKNPLTLFAVLAMTHAAPEGALGGQYGFMLKGQFALLLVAVAVRYVFPVVGSIFLSSQSGRMRSAGTFLLQGSDAHTPQQQGAAA